VPSEKYPQTAILAFNPFFKLMKRRWIILREKRDIHSSCQRLPNLCAIDIGHLQSSLLMYLVMINQNSYIEEESGDTSPQLLHLHCCIQFSVTAGTRIMIPLG